MPHTIETATSARAKCRGCDQKIAKDELRFGERQPNAFGEGEMTLWFHLPCAAYKRPAPFLEIAASSGEPAAAALVPVAELGIAHRRLPRVNGAERAPTGRARCRSCKRAHRAGQLADRAHVLRGIPLFRIGLRARRVRGAVFRDDRPRRSRRALQPRTHRRRPRRAAQRAARRAGRPTRAAAGALARRRRMSSPGGSATPGTGARHGAQFLQRLRERPPALWYRGERVDNVDDAPRVSRRRRDARGALRPAVGARGRVPLRVADVGQPGGTLVPDGRARMPSSRA